jgi:hypothetical protein
LTPRPREGFAGTTLRYFEPKSEIWSAIFIDWENDSVATPTGGAAGDNQLDLHQQGTDGGNSETRDSKPTNLAQRAITLRYRS